MALEALYQGEAVKRKAWGMNGEQIWLQDGVIWTYTAGECLKEIRAEWSPAQADLLADPSKVTR